MSKNKGIGSVGAAVAGAVVGAAAGAAAVILSDEEKRKEITKAAQGAMKAGEKKFEELKDQAAGVVEDVVKKLDK